MDMSSSRVRLRILRRIAQLQQGAVSSTSGQATPATSENTAVPPDPSGTASSLYPTLRTGFDPARVGVIDTLARVLSSAANVATKGQYNLQNLKNINFQFDPSSFGSPDQKNLLVFFQKVYRTLLNNGQPYTAPVSADQVRQMVPYLLQSPELANLSQINPTGQIAQKSPISGNFKENIRALVSRLQPTVPTRRA